MNARHNKLWNVCLEIYQKMYKEAKPSANFRELRAKGETSKQEWFMHYYLKLDRQQEIIDEVCRKHKIPRCDKVRIMAEVLLGVSPNSSKETWNMLRRTK